MKKKSQVYDIFTRFKVLVENRFQSKLKTLYTDNGGEYIALSTYLSTHGISHFTTPPHTPEHNGIAERRHRHIVETGLSLLTHASMPKSYWTYAMATAVYLINRMPTQTLSLKSPFECLFGNIPNFSKLKIFGCLCFPWLRPYASNKLDSRSTPCVFLGYSTTQSAYFCLDRSTSRIYTSRHVSFHEYVFPFSLPTELTSSVSPDETVLDESPSPTPQVSVIPLVPSSAPPQVSPIPPQTTQAPPPSHTQTTPTVAAPSSQSPQPGDIPTAAEQITPITMEPQAQNTTIPSAESEQDTTMPSDQAAHVPAAQPPPRASTRPRKPVQRLNLRATVTPLTEEIPTTVQQALKDPRWRRAMYEELEAQLKNHTWDVVTPRKHINIVGCKWVFTIKRHADGSIDRFKARLVAKGFTQRPGLDYNETFSPVVKPATIRLVLSVSVSNHWPIRQFDVNHAFLQGQLDDEVYMMQPPGFTDQDNPHGVCRLRKAVYGLKQAPRAWYNELRTFLLQSGFTNSIADASLFIYNQNGVLLYMLVYVDDIILTGNNNTHLQKFITSFSTRFSLKDLGNISYFLGMEAHRNTQGLLLTQNRYIADLLTRTKMSGAKPVATPMCPNTTLTLKSGDLMKDPTQYRAVVGSLQYLSLTRPDISFAVNRLSQYMHQPTTEHWNAVKRLLRYLVGTQNQGLYFATSNTPSLHAYTDADWAGNKDDYTSTGAYIVYFGRHPIAWSSKKQTGVARSSTEAEYRSIASTTAEICWIQSLISELGVRTTGTPAIYCDNIGATYLAANPVFHSRMKHLALDYHFVRHQVQQGNVRVTHVASQDQLADALTKPLHRSRFQMLMIKIGLAKGAPS